MNSAIPSLILAISLLTSQGNTEYDPVTQIFRDNKDLKGWSVIEDTVYLTYAEWGTHYPALRKVFPEYGLTDIMKLNYLGSEGQVISVEVFHMNDPSGAYGLFSVCRGEGGLMAGFGSESYAVDSCLHLWKGDYYVKIRAEQGKKAGWGSISEIAILIDKRIETEGEKPEIVQMVPEEGFVTENTRYFKGKEGMNLYFRTGLEFVNGFSEGVFSDFGTYRLLLLRYENAEKREKWSEKVYIKLEGCNKYRIMEDSCAGRCYVDVDGNILAIGFTGQYMMIFSGMDITMQPELFERIEDAILKDVFEDYQLNP